MGTRPPGWLNNHKTPLVDLYDVNQTRFGFSRVLCATEEGYKQSFINRKNNNASATDLPINLAKPSQNQIQNTQEDNTINAMLENTKQNINASNDIIEMKQSFFELQNEMKNAQNQLKNMESQNSELRKEITLISKNQNDSALILVKINESIEKQRVQMNSEESKSTISVNKQQAELALISAELNDVKKKLENYICPITLEPMKYPVMAKDGWNYEKDAIIDQIRKNKISPRTREPLSENELIRNLQLEAEIQELLKKQNELQNKILNFY